VDEIGLFLGAGDDGAAFLHRPFGLSWPGHLNRGTVLMASTRAVAGIGRRAEGHIGGGVEHDADDWRRDANLTGAADQIAAGDSSVDTRLNDAVQVVQLIGVDRCSRLWDRTNHDELLSGTNALPRPQPAPKSWIVECPNYSTATSCQLSIISYQEYAVLPNRG
jgi:hypothetical protein